MKCFLWCLRKLSCHLTEGSAGRVLDSVPVRRKISTKKLHYFEGHLDNTSLDPIDSAVCECVDSINRCPLLCPMGEIDIIAIRWPWPRRPSVWGACTFQSSKHCIVRLVVDQSSQQTAVLYYIVFVHSFDQSTKQWELCYWITNQALAFILISGTVTHFFVKHKIGSTTFVLDCGIVQPWD